MTTMIGKLQLGVGENGQKLATMVKIDRHSIKPAITLLITTETLYFEKHTTQQGDHLLVLPPAYANW